ncbi:hypothetical protein ACIQMV_19205 [Streptomyces sp. NPDC091412]|uniref:hypothetical protein n=1 Tax=Streptomyces sp. NPDC091412 TaxID=3366002 RepID=UPI00380DAFA9
MFTEKVTSESGSESRGTATEVHALSLLRRSYNRGYAITATREGGALIRWRKVNPATSCALRSISLRPHTEVGDLSEETRRNLAVIDSVRVARYARSIERPGCRIIEAGTYEIPVAQTDVLTAHRLVVADRNGRLRLTLSARLAQIAQEHASVIDPSAPVVTCLCGFTVHARNEEKAAQLQHAHQARVGALFVESLSATFTAAVAATA